MPRVRSSMHVVILVAVDGFPGSSRSFDMLGLTSWSRWSKDALHRALSHWRHESDSSGESICWS